MGVGVGGRFAEVDPCAGEKKQTGKLYLCWNPDFKILYYVFFLLLSRSIPSAFHVNVLLMKLKFFYTRTKDRITDM